MIILRPTRTTQPQEEAALALENPITKRLDALFDTSCKGIVTEVVTGKVTSTVGASTQAISSIGRATFFNGANASIATSPFIDDYSNGRSIAFYFNPGVTNNSIQDARIYEKGANNEITITYSSIDGLKFQFGGTVVVTVPNSRFNNGAWHSVVALIPPGSVTIYVDGVLAGTAAGAPPGTDQIHNICLYGGGSVYNYRGLLAYICNFGRLLSTKEVLSLSQNPWQLFANKRQRIVSLPAAGGATVSVSTGQLVTTGQSVSTKIVSNSSIGYLVEAGTIVAGPLVSILGTALSQLVTTGQSVSTKIVSNSSIGYLVEAGTIVAGPLGSIVQGSSSGLLSTLCSVGFLHISSETAWTQEIKPSSIWAEEIKPVTLWN